MAYFDRSDRLIRWNEIFVATFEVDVEWLKTNPSFTEIAQKVCCLLAIDSPSLTRDWWERAGKNEQANDCVPIELGLANGKIYLTKQSAISTHGQVFLLEDVTTLVQREVSLEQSNRDLEQFAYIASHDLQEPLRMVASFTELLRIKYDGDLDETAREYIQYAVDDAHRMQILLEELLLFSRVNGEKPDKRLIDLNEVCREAMLNLSGVIKETKAKIFVDDRLLVAPGNHTQLTQVFQNLDDQDVVVP